MVYSYDEATKYILEIPKFTKKNPMDNTRHLMKCLGNPQDLFKIIHVAGTNGKGSVCMMVNNILCSAGKSVGLFTSPHLVDMRERIRVNSILISKEDFLEAFNTVYEAVQKMKEDGYDHPTFFEYIFAVAMVAFKNSDTEYVILETGLGGRLDATNVVEKPIVTAITSIGMDHVEYLGDTVGKIALEKAGIIKKNVPLIFVSEDEEVRDVILEVAEDKTEKITAVDEKCYTLIKKQDNHIDFSMDCGYYCTCVFETPFIAEYQIQNAAVAVSIIEAISDIPAKYVIDGIKNVCWEGRMEEVAGGIILDGAHNEPGIREFAKTVSEMSVGGRKLLLFSAVKDKQFDQMIKLLLDGTDFSGIYITEIEGQRKLKADLIADTFRKYADNIKITVYEDIEQAFNSAVKEKDEEDVLFVAGSLYLVGSIKSIIERNRNND